ncbi:MAG TPA: ABC transporter permease [Casimicrobiaceae bacterium]|jgi:sodium transport system permease protein|nr:ABC transporter permease [Casimicrobiaceae bacterium]
MHRTLAVLRKELLDMFRDRRTGVVTLMSSILAGPIFLLLIFNLMANQAERARTLTLPTQGARHAPAIVAFLERQQVKITQAPADYEAQIRRGDLDVVLVVDDAFATDVAQGRPGTVRLVFDRSRERARASIDQAEALLHGYERLWGEQRLMLRGVASTVANPLRIETNDLATPQQSGALVLFLVAYYGLFASVMGGMAAALDTTAGERERQSLEPLLMTPARPFEIVVGKWLAVCAFDALVVVLTLSGFYLTLAFAPLPPVGVPFLFGTREFLRFLIVLVPMVLMLPAILLYVGSRARAYREAQANVSVLLFVVSLIPLVQLFMQRKEPPWLGLVPVSAQYSLLNTSLRGEAPASGALALSWIAPLALVIVALVAVARHLSRESILGGK